MTALAVLAGMAAFPFGRQLLADAGCALIHGWIAAHPMPGAELVRWLSAADLAVDRQRQA